MAEVTKFKLETGAVTTTVPVIRPEPAKVVQLAPKGKARGKAIPPAPLPRPKTAGAATGTHDADAQFEEF